MKKIHVIGLIVLLSIFVTACGQADDPLAFPDYDEQDLITTETGLQYLDEVVGDGATATGGDLVSVRYSGWLTDEELFDSSYNRDQTFEFQIGAFQVISGWDEGVAGMNIGGTRILVIPSYLAYADRGAAGGLIPPGATLIFRVELEEIN